jgi:hypothetical protein
MKKTLLTLLFLAIAATAYAQFTVPSSWSGIGQSPIRDSVRCQTQFYAVNEAQCTTDSQTNAHCDMTMNSWPLQGPFRARVQGTVTGNQFRGDLTLVALQNGQPYGGVAHQGVVEFQTGIARPPVYYTFDEDINHVQHRAQCVEAYNGNNLTAYYTGFW